MKTVVVNMFGGPGTGKSTVAMHVAALLKWRGRNIELASEYAKDKVWERSLDVLTNQVYVFGSPESAEEIAELTINAIEALKTMAPA